MGLRSLLTGNKMEKQNKPEYSQKIMDLAAKPGHRGAFFQEDATLKDMALVEAKHQDIKFYWLVHPQSDTVYSTRFFAYGGTLSVAIGEMLSIMAEDKPFYQAVAITPEEIEQQLRDVSDKPLDPSLMEKHLSAVPVLLLGLKEAYPNAKNVALTAIEVKKNKAAHAPNFESLGEKEKKWMETPVEEQIARIEEVLDRDIRYGLNTDGGDVTIMGLEEGYKLKIKWEGACGGCSSSQGATLSYVENHLRNEVFSGIEVVPESETWY